MKLIIGNEKEYGVLCKRKNHMKVL